MKSDRFNIHVCNGRFVLLIVCFTLLPILIFASVSSSSPTRYPTSLLSLWSLNLAFADDMMGGMPSAQDAPATTGATTDAPPGHDGDDGDGDDDTPATTGALTAVPPVGDGKEGDDDDDKDDNPGNTKKQDSNDALIATQVGNCPTGQEHDIFTNECEPNVITENPGKAGPTTPMPNACPASFNPYEKESMILRAKSEGSTMLKHSLAYITIQSPGLNRGLEQSVEPRVQPVDDLFLNCKFTNDIDPITKINTRTIELPDGRKIVQQIEPVEGDERGKVILEDKYDNLDLLTASTLKGPNGVQTDVAVKDRYKDVIITKGGQGVYGKFMVTPQDSIITSGSEKRDGNYRVVEAIDSTTGVKIKFAYGDERAPGWKGIKVLKPDDSPLTDFMMAPDGALHFTPPDPTTPPTKPPARK